jgi:hypothetical protein
MALTVRLEAFQDASPLPRSTLHLPADRDAANVLGRRGPTLEDVREFHHGTRTSFVDRCPVIFGTSDLPHGEGSKRHDEDWTRLVACYDPWVGQTTLRGIVYTPGTLSGCWSGHTLVCQSEFSNLCVY